MVINGTKWLLKFCQFKKKKKEDFQHSKTKANTNTLKTNPLASFTMYIPNCIALRYNQVNQVSGRSRQFPQVPILPSPANQSSLNINICSIDESLHHSLISQSFHSFFCCCSSQALMSIYTGHFKLISSVHSNQKSNKDKPLNRQNGDLRDQNLFSFYVDYPTDLTKFHFFPIFRPISNIFGFQSHILYPKKN